MCWCVPAADALLFIFLDSILIVAASQTILRTNNSMNRVKRKRHQVVSLAKCSPEILVCQTALIISLPFIFQLQPWPNLVSKWDETHLIGFPPSSSSKASLPNSYEWSDKSEEISLDSRSDSTASCSSSTSDVCRDAAMKTLFNVNKLEIWVFLG